MEEEYKEMWEYEMERRREKLEKWRKRGWLPISEEKMIKYELNQMTFEDWYDDIEPYFHERRLGYYVR